MKIDPIQLINCLAENQRLIVDAIAKEHEQEVINACSIKIKESQGVISGISVMGEAKDECS